MKILLVVPYYGGSHRAWADGYARHSRHQVDLLTLPARFWKWRMQGGAATLAANLRVRLSEGQERPDLVLATDMVNLPAFLGLTREILSGVPVALYCHENQLTYPLREGEKRDLTYPMINWLSMLAADRVFFNSRFHRDSWFRALPSLLKHFPDASHLLLLPGVKARSEVLPVGVALRALDAVGGQDEPAAGGDPPLILWNQRWEYDKNPRTFFWALDALAAQGVPFRVALAGSSVRQQAKEFESARARLGDRVVHYGRAERGTYHRLLWEADIVVSTAHHEFFGIAVVEAIYCQTFPVLPCRLAYPELVPKSVHARCLYEDPDGLVDRLSWALRNVTHARALAGELRPAVERFAWAEMAPRYDEVLAGIHTQ